MNESKNLLLKLFVLLTIVVGWGSSAWAQGFPVEGQVYTIKARFANDQYDSYLTNGGTNLTFVHTESETTVGSYWVAERSGATNFQWRFRNVADESKFLNASSGLGDATNTNSHFNVRNCTNVGGGLYHLEGMITNRSVGTWGYSSGRSGFGSYGGFNCWASNNGHYNAGSPAWSTDYEIAPVTNYKLIINGDDNYTVTYDGTGYSNGATMPSFDEANLKDLKGFSINCSGNFVYGPVIRKDRKTVTYTISNPETSLNEGWYQMQVVPNNNVNSRIAARSSNINTQSPSIYAMAMVNECLDTGSSYWGMKYSGVPAYAKEASTFVYLKPNGSNATQVLLPTGHYMKDDGCTNRDAVNVTTRFQNNMFAAKRWIESGRSDWDEAPAAAAADNYQRDMALRKIDLTQYSVYKVEIDNWAPAANTFLDPTVTIKSASTANAKNRGLSKVYRNGYFFFERGYEPTLEDFDVSGVDFTEMTMDIEDTGDVKTLHFKEASTESWFTIKNTRKNYFISVSANGLEDNQQLKWGVSTATTAGEYWMMEQDGTNGFYLINKAYGPDYVLGMESTSNGARLRMYHRSDAVSDNTHFDRVATSNGGFSIVQHGHNNIGFHDLSSNFAIWNSNNVHDPGSNFVFTRVEDAVINAVPDYTVYKVDVQGSGRQQARYEGTQENVIGQTAVQEGRYILLKSDYVAIPEDFNYSEVAVSNSDTEPSYKILTLSGEEKLPRILHRRAYFYDKYNTVSDDKRPASSSYVGKEYPDDTADADKGFVMNGSTKIQKTAEYRIPIYIEPGSNRQMYMPTDKLAYYQRWYDYKTETLVNQGVMPELYSSNFKTYSNGHVAGKVASGIHAFWQSGITMYLPTTLPKDADDLFYEDYIVGVDVSRFKDNSTNNATGDLTEPTLSQRVLFEIKDANRIATKLTACVDNDKWLESRNIIFPTIKRGTTAHFTDKDALPIDMDMNNYWVYNASHQLVQLTEPNQISVRVDDNTANISAELMPSIGSTVGWGGVNFSQSHFISFSYPGEGAVRTVPDNSHATVKVYFVEGGKEYQLAKFELTFVPNTDPKIITEVIGRQENGEYKSQRSPYWLEENFGRPVAELTFDNKNILMKDNLPDGGVDNAGGTDIGTYLFPLDFDLTNYAYGYEKGDGTARGEYTMANARHIPGQANFRFKPVQHYYDVLNGTSSEANNDQFYLYVDASDQPGEVMSLQINEHLCEGTRLYVSGWMSVTSYSSNPASVLLNLVAKNSTTGDSKILTSYCPGILHTFMFDENGNEVAKMDRTTGEASSGIVVNTQYWGLWSQLSFSFLLPSDDARNYDTFQVQVLNNCYNSSGGDYLLDNFQIFANPPKGNVDFTTPLCSDKVRHAKVHADYDMLKDLSADGVNDVGNDATWDIAASYCFVDAEMFDNYQVPAELGDNLTVKDLFVMDEKGSHNLKPEYNSDKAEEVINKAFDAAMVGRRCTKDKTDAEGNKYKDFGFHSFIINKDYEQIPVYAYNDSENDVVYREIDGEVRRVVFKEDVVRGEMYKLTDKSDSNREYYPYMRPSRTYYLIFAPQEVTEESLIKNGIRKDDVATDIFGIHQTCSFFGKFTTKDPLHVILDNAEIEADLPVRAVCHGETVDFSFDMPALKFDTTGNPKYPITDEEYCVSDPDLDGQLVPSTHGARHYHYESSFTTNAVMDVIKDMPYDWWLGGTLEGTTFGGKIEDYLAATHPTITYSGPADIAHKQDGDNVNIAQAMTDFRFFYPTEDGTTWSSVTPKPYNHDTGYGLLQSEINTIKAFVDAGILVLYKTQYTMPLTANKSETLTDDELSKMTSDELNRQILALALVLDDDPAIAAGKPLKKLESTVLDQLSDAGRLELTLQELANEPIAQVKTIAEAMLTQGYLTDVTSEQINTMPERDLRKAVETALKAMNSSYLRTFVQANFTDLGPEKRAHLVIRALNLMSEETLAAMTEADRNNPAYVRQVLRDKMIAIFSAQEAAVLRKMWSDTSAKLTDEERSTLLGTGNPADMTSAQLGTLLEHALATVTNGIIDDLNSDRYIHFTLVPIMPSQENYVDEPYIFCPEPRGVKMRITTHEPRMIDGFADMPYPSTMDNVPVRIGLQQIKETQASAAKTLRIPVRGLKQAAKNGVKAVKLEEGVGYSKYIFLVETDDVAYQQTVTPGTMADAKITDDIYDQMVGTIEGMTANYPTTAQPNPDNFLIVKFADDMNFREGYTYRVGINFIEHDVEGHETLSCPGTMLFDLKIVPEYQKWTGAVSDDWTNDQNWQRADRSELHADNSSLGTGAVISRKNRNNTTVSSTEFVAEANYPSNASNQTSGSFIPMKFTNTLIATAANAMPHLYNVTPAHRSYVDSEDNLVPGAFAVLNTTTATDEAKYDMEVYYADGTWHTGDHYECGLFGTYVANGITFEPATMMYNAQLLDYEKAWVEYELDYNRWYTLASPLQNTYAGEWYSPTEGGRQLTPHFYEVKYHPDINDRFNPAYYQRSWDKVGEAWIYRMTDDGGTYVGFENDIKKNADGAITNVRVQKPTYLNWSYVYNDVEVPYSNGGFSVNVRYTDATKAPAAGSKALVRMPKADATYEYYENSATAGDNGPVHGDESQTLNRTGHHRLMSDFLAHDDDPLTTPTINQFIVNASPSNPYFLVGNPFMAPMNMGDFFAEQTCQRRKDATGAYSPDGEPGYESTFVPGKYWILEGTKQNVNIKVGNSWISTDGNADAGVVAPLQGFFVQMPVDAATGHAVLPEPIAGATAGNGIRLAFSADVQQPMEVISYNNDGSPIYGYVNGEDSDGNPFYGHKPTLKTRRRADAAQPALFRITATNGSELESNAVVYFSEQASNRYVASEDAETLLDGNIADKVSTVFTAAPSTRSGQAQQALSINSMSTSVKTIPVGVIAPKDDTRTTLRFSGISQLEAVMGGAPHLYDAENDTFQVLDEETAVTVAGTTAGRYFIVCGTSLPFAEEADAEAEADYDGKVYNLHGIRVATPQRGNVTIRGSRKEYTK